MVIGPLFLKSCIQLTNHNRFGPSDQSENCKLFAKKKKKIERLNPLSNHLRENS